MRLGTFAALGVGGVVDREWDFRTDAGEAARVVVIAGPPGSGKSQWLRAVAALRQLTERLEILQVDNARALGWSWQQIAERLGVTKQTVHRKHGRRTGRR